ncbi:MAG: DUF3883 domain-containing protein [Phycisphaerales bacterium]|nr:DUF3883 domain-containing protein [Phycisphaerales bacterium]
MLLADRYDNRAHFIFELLQNAEDALRRRVEASGPRSITFTLGQSELRVSHFGQPFDNADIRGVCGIGQSTKPTELTAIGRFGIGFKSVFAFTGSPEVHSGSEHFAIDSFVWPRAIAPRPTSGGETLFVLPFRPTDSLAHQEIAKGLRDLGARTLLFLRHIDEIAWRVEGGPSGLYLRSKPEGVAPGVRQLALVGQDSESPDTEENWLIFSREVQAPDGTPAGQIEIAFAISSPLLAKASVRKVSDSTLVVYFPTIVPTHCGFLLQGPYRTTPSRDNVPRHDDWNQQLVQLSAELLVGSLQGLRDMGLLTVDAIRALPLDRSQFDEHSMFTPLFDAVRAAFTAERLLPAFRGGHATGGQARLARTKELRELLSPAQLRDLFSAPADVHWLSEEITQDRTPELRQYLLRELQVAELDPERMLARLSKEFLEAQSDAWITSLCAFLNGQPGLWQRGQLNDKPIVRLESGGHVAPWNGNLPLAFLPGEHASGFPTVRATIAAHPDARKFLLQLGLTEPDPVDDVIANVLPRYHAESVDMDEEKYAADIRRILAAFGTDSKAQREKLVTALRDTAFVRAADGGDTETFLAKPGDLYVATERLSLLFQGIHGVHLVDDSCPCLRGEDVRKLLDACGAALYLQPTDVAADLSYAERREMRRQAGQERCSSEFDPDDSTIRGLDTLLAILPTLTVDDRRKRAALLWKALADVEDRRGSGSFQGRYSWFYHTPYSTTFDAKFVRTLNTAHWIPDTDGELQQPAVVLFDSLGWDNEPFLLSKIRFKPPIIDTLAREAGIEPGLIDLLKKLGVTSESELRARLQITTPPDPPETGPAAPGSAENNGHKVAGDGTAQTDSPGGSPPAQPEGDAPPAPPTDPQRKPGTGPGTDDTTPGAGTAPDHERRRSPSPPDRDPESHTRRFHSYVGVHNDEHEPDPDGLTRDARMSIEEDAIATILAEEPSLLRTAVNNPGFDLLGPSSDDRPDRRIEVKAMTRDLKSRPVGMTHVQFESAKEYGDRYWLYVVEFASDPSRRRVLRIQDPAGKARSFTFDAGWAAIAAAAPQTS